MYGCLRVLEQLGTRGLRQMKGISPLLNSYISNLQFLRSERSEEGFYSKIMHITKIKSPRNTWFAAYWRQNPTLEVLYSIFQIFTIGAKRGVFLSIKNSFYGYNPALHDTMAASGKGEFPIKKKFIRKLLCFLWYPWYNNENAIKSHSNL